jgi:uncharacterized protein
MSNADIRGRFMWHELMTTDTDAAGAFYSKVMPWKAQASGMPGYTLWFAGKTQAGGMMALPAEATGAQPHWLTYIGTPSVDSAVENVQRLGGKVLKSAADIPNVGRFAVVADPQGAAFALYTPAAGSMDGAGAGGAAPGGYSWHELATTDLNGAVSFYTELFGWEKGPGHDMGGDVGIYQLITQNGQQIGGMFKSPNAPMPPSWLTYVHVADIDKAANAVKGGGGRIMNGPHQVPGGSWIVQAMDPQGGTFAIIEPAEMAAAQKPAAPAKPTGAAKPAAPKPAAAPSKPAASAPAKPAAAPKKKAAAKAAKKAAKKTARKAAPKAAKKAAKKAGKKKAAAKRGKKAASASRAKKKAPAKVKAKGRAKARGKRR